MSEMIEIKDAGNKGTGAFATEKIQAGTLILVSKIVNMCPERTRFSFQVGTNEHADMSEPLPRLNHSCDPNTGLKPNEFGAYNVYARRDIEIGEELTWCYPTTEYISIAVKACSCGSANCNGKVTGWEGLSEEMKATFLREGIVAPFIAKRHVQLAYKDMSN